MPSKLFGQRMPVGHLGNRPGGLKGEVYDLRKDMDATVLEMETRGMVGLVTEEFTNLATADTDAFVLSFASAASIISLVAADLDGVVGADEISPPRNVTITTSTHANIDAVAVVVTGKVRNKYGKLIAQTDTITTTDGGGVTDAGTKAFSIVETITIPAMSGTAGAIEIGFGTAVGLSYPLRAIAGFSALVLQVIDGTAAMAPDITSATTLPAADAPNGTWTPSTAANGTHDYAITYMVDPAL